MLAAALVCWSVPNASSHAGQHGPGPTDSQPEASVLWLVFIDDLHLHFTDTGRIRKMLRAAIEALVVKGDLFAVGCSGPSCEPIAATSDRHALERAASGATGNALRASDIVRTSQQAAGWNEVRYRAQHAMKAAGALLDESLRAMPDRAAMLYVSNGYSGADADTSAALSALQERGRRQGVPIFTLDPRLLDDGPRPDAALDASAWHDYWSSSRTSLETLAASTGGVPQEPGTELRDVLTRIGAVARWRP